MLNVDNKLLVKIITIRILPHLDKFIHESQTDFIRNRNIAENIKKILHAMNYASEEKLEALIVSLDFDKAFDCAEIKSCRTRISIDIKL